MRRYVWLVAALSGLASTTLSAGPARAHHVQVQIYTDSPRPRTSAPVTTPTVVVATPPATPQPTLQVHDLTANRVRAQTIYANTIDADELRGAVHRIDGLEIGAPQGEITASEIGAAVIYADTITANSVEATTIYVRDREVARVGPDERRSQSP